MAFKSWLNCLLVTTALIGLSSAQCTTAPPALTGGNYSVIFTGQLVVYFCNSGTFSTNDTAITSSCSGSTWTAITATCSSTSPSGSSQQCSGNPIQPNNTQEINATSPASTKMKIYACTGNMQWLSGELARVSQCQSGNWSVILDICDVGCPIPRHCADVAALGLTGDGDFYVIPSGQSYGQIYTVHCTLNNTDGNEGGNWTYIFKTNKANFATYTTDLYLNGINQTNYTSSTQYFIGLYYLSNVSMSLPNDPAGMVLEVLFLDTNNNAVAYSTYNNFTVGPPSTSFTLTSLGKYHGTAGDGLCPHLSTQFLLNGGTTTDPLWWGALVANISTFVTMNNGSFLTYNGTWKTLDPALATPVTTIVMRIRPTVEDNAVFCPPMVGSEYWWKNTNATIPLSRKVGTVISWQCFGDYIEEGEDGGTRTFFGNSTCMEGQPPYWSYNVTLPCTLNCPSGFIESADATVCFNFSTDAASNITDASNKCRAKGAYLTTVKGPGDLDVSDNNTEYYTANVARGSNASQLIPPLLTTVLDNCSTVCQPNKSSQCTVVQYPDKYEHVSCLTSHNYLCQLQAYCPRPDYYPFGGMCLKLLSSATSASAASMACAAEGASLVYPTTLAQANNISLFVAWNDTAALRTASVSYVIATNNFGGDWTSGGKYVMGDLQPSLTTDPVKFWREMTVAPDRNYTFKPIDINEPLTSVKAICTLFGYIGCDGYCPIPAGNMIMVNGSVNSTDMGSTATYQCYPGYFFNTTGNPNVTNSTCNGPLGGKTGWIPSVINDCIPLPVCQNSTLTVQSALLTNSSVNITSYYLNSTITFTCPAKMAFFTNGSTIMNTTCTTNQTGYMFNQSVIPACNVCLDNVTVNNATTNVTAGTYLSVGSVVAATCNAGYEVAFNTTVQYIPCTETGYNMTGIKDCFLGCTGLPPSVNVTDNVVAQNETANAIGTILSYNCTPGYSFVVSTNYTNVTNTATATCSPNGTWVTSRTPLKCDLLCASDPPAAPTNTNSSWDGLNRNKGLQVIYTATIPGMLFGNFSTTWTIVCNGSLWLPVDNSSTSPTGNGMLTARKACLLDPPTNIGGALPVNWNTSAKGFIGQNITYSCSAGQYTTTGINTTMITCDSATSNWTIAPATFVCKMACNGAPPAAPTRASYNYTGDFTEGVVVAYYCAGGFQGGLGSNITNNCTSGNWSMVAIPTCLTITTPGPTTIPPVVLPETSNALLYASTTTTYFSAIDTFNTTSGIKGDYTLVNSLVGFGYGIQLIKNKSECMIKPQYVPDYKTCEINPNNCAAGLSFSIWALVLYDDSVYDMSSITVDDYQYFASTGADQNGHPGIAMGVAKQWLFALVSTGNQYWYTQILGQLRNNTWNNVGVRWSKSMGMEVYVNATRVGYTNVSKSVNAMPSYSPPMLILGCQKTQSEASYHSYLNGYLDEFAIWPYTVNLTNNQSLLFLGGYTSNITDMSPAEFQAMLQNVVISNPGQQAAAVKILSQLTSQQMLATSSPPTASQASATGASPSASADSPAPTTPPPGNVQGLQSIGNILMQLLDPTRTPVTLTPDAASSMLKVSQSLSDVLSSDNTAAWKVIQNQTESVSPIQLAQQFRQYHAKICQAIQYTNVSTPICEEQVYSNLYYKYCKMTISDLGNMGSKVQLPDYTQPSLKSLREMWDDILTDRVAFPTNCFTDIRCSSRPVSFIFHYYGYVDQTAPGTANPVSVPRGSLTAVDSRLMNIDLVVDKAVDANGNPDTSQPLCEVDAELMLANQLTYKAVHIDQVSAQVTPRKILLFENMSVTDVKQRLCVQWNENISDIGAWDSTGCDITVDTDEFSICACTVFGLFSIMAIKSEPIVIPTEPSWVFVLKYILYGVSAISIILYIVVVLYSGDLKDQFHLVGLHLAFAILIGSIAMVLSDFHSVQSDRNSCTIIGTIMHICYGAVGMWMIGLGHASFNGITAGVIGGRLLSYCLLCWGASFAFAGVPFLTMLTQMGYDPRCFIGWDNIVKWVFFAPQMAAAILSMFFALVILCNLSTPALRKENLIRDYSSFCRGAALLIIYLCATWVFGLLAYMRLGIAIDFYPIFQVLNSLSGTCLLFFIGFGSERFRSILAGQAKARHEMLRQHAFGFPEGDEKQKSSSKLPSNTPSTASTANLVPEEPTVPLEEF